MTPNTNGRLNYIILLLAVAGGGFWAHNLTASIDKLEVTLQDRNDRLIRVEEAVSRLREAVEGTSQEKKALAVTLESIRTRLLILEHPTVNR